MLLSLQFKNSAKVIGIKYKMCSPTKSLEISAYNLSHKNKEINITKLEPKTQPNLLRTSTTVNFQKQPSSYKVCTTSKINSLITIILRDGFTVFMSFSKRRRRKKEKKN